MKQVKMTADEHIRLVDVGDDFWHAFSRLCAQHIAMMPKHLESETVAYLGDKTSIYGSIYDEYLEEARRNVP